MHPSRGHGSGRRSSSWATLSIRLGLLALGCGGQCGWMLFLNGRARLWDPLLLLHVGVVALNSYTKGEHCWVPLSPLGHMPLVGFLQLFAGLHLRKYGLSSTAQ